MPSIPAKKPEAVKPLILSLKGEVTPRVPFWLMRQAGRYLPEYKEVRQKAGSFLNLCFTPEYAAEVTLQPLRRYNMDAAILFSDILVVPYALGQKLDFAEGEGPRLEPLRDQRGFDALDLDGFSDKLEPVFETIRLVKSRLPADKALIGFAGAPWTVACYMIQGRGDHEFTDARIFSLTQGPLFTRLMERLVEATALYLIRQIETGVDAVQIFDSWAGLLPEPLFTKWVIEPARAVVSRIREQYPDFPVIGFPRGAGAMIAPYAARTGVSCVSLDTQVPLSWALREFGGDVCLQGNLDPLALLAGGAVLEDEALRILNAARAQPFVFNLGHGINKNTPPEHVARLAEIIRSFAR